jgi:Arc/MetJ-type ribon-helix-helix transcriptional regulator
METRKNCVNRFAPSEIALAEAVTEKGGYRNRSEMIRTLIAAKARQLRIKRTSPEVMAKMACGTEGATDGE